MDLTVLKNETKKYLDIYNSAKAKFQEKNINDEWKKTIERSIVNLSSPGKENVEDIKKIISNLEVLVIAANEIYSEEELKKFKLPVKPKNPLPGIMDRRKEVCPRCPDKIQESIGASEKNDLIDTFINKLFANFNGRLNDTGFSLKNINTSSKDEDVPVEMENDDDPKAPELKPKSIDGFDAYPHKTTKLKCSWPSEVECSEWKETQYSILVSKDIVKIEYKEDVDKIDKNSVRIRLFKTTYYVRTERTISYKYKLCCCVTLGFFRWPYDCIALYEKLSDKISKSNEYPDTRMVGEKVYTDWSQELYDDLMEFLKKLLGGAGESAGKQIGDNLAKPLAEKIKEKIEKELGLDKDEKKDTNTTTTDGNNPG